MDNTLQPEPVLAAEIAQWAATAPDGLAIAERCGRTILRLEWRASPKVMLAGNPLPPIGQALSLEAGLLLRVSPVSALAISDQLAPRDLADRCAMADAACVDVSHGYVVLSLTGHAALALLDGMVPVDLEGPAFGPGRVRRTQISGHAATIHCRDGEDFDLYVDRSLAWSLWQLFRSRPLPRRGWRGRDR